METTCQRCHEPLRETDHYCSACGLPQLVYVASEIPPPLPGEDEAEGVEGAGVPGAGMAGISPGGIAWRHALVAALVLAIPAAALTSSLPPVGLVWTVIAAAWAVATYARRARTGHLSTGTGARIGLLTGLFVSWLTAAFVGVGLWASRFVLHQGGQWDSFWQAQVEKSFDSNQVIAQMGTANLQAVQLNQAMHAFALSANGRAAIPLSGIVLIGAFVVVFATVGGAVGARFAVPVRHPNA